MKTYVGMSLLFLHILLLVSEAICEKFLNQWIAEIHGGEEAALRVARDLGFVYKGKAGPFENHYELAREDHPVVSRKHSNHLTRNLMDVKQVKWAEQQQVVERSSRANIPQKQKKKRNPNTFFGIRELLYSRNIDYYSSNHLNNVKRAVQKSSISTPKKIFPTTQCKEDSLTYSGVTRHGNCSSSLNSPYKYLFNDPLWPVQWYVQDYRTYFSPVMNLNVIPLYQMGITGKGVRVMIVDDGIEFGHPDLKRNYVDELSYDFCRKEQGCEPEYVDEKKLGHGTKCAGTVAMEANNNMCGVGIAFDAYIAGAKIFCPGSTRYLESLGLTHELYEVDVYSCSWGPPDNGQIMEEIGPLKAKAVDMGITKGRDGKGALYVFAAGNGRDDGDNCAADGPVNYVGTISIASVSQEGKPAYYSERCTAIFAATYSGSGRVWEATVSSFIYGECTTRFSGTSASTPIAAGIFALILQVNPKLTYRDMMHLIAMTSEVAPLADNKNIWYKNGKGFWVSNDFGFGLLNAENMALKAKDWHKVPEKDICEIPIISWLSEAMDFETSQFIVLSKDTTVSCRFWRWGQDKILFLEEIELTASITYPFRGALTINITSPAGTETTLLEPRFNDDNEDGLNDWKIKSVHNWGEDPRGEWIIKIGAVSVPEMQSSVGFVKKVILTFHGTYEKPAHYNLPRTYSAFRLPNDETPWTKVLNIL